MSGTTATQPGPGGIKGLLARITALPWVAHLARAGTYYVERQADLLAAAITYFGFLALTPVILLAVSIAGFVLSGNPDLLNRLVEQIRVAVPGDLGVQLVDGVQLAIDKAGTVGVIGLVGLLYAGIGWMSKMRIAMQTIWKGTPEKHGFVRDNLGDLLSLLSLGSALLASVLLTAAANGLTGFLLELVGLDGVPGIGLLTRLLGIIIGISGTTLIFLWLFIRVPSTALPVRAVLPGAVFGAVGFEILKVVGTYYLASVSQSPATAALGSAVGVLVWIYFSSRFLLFAAAWTSTLPAVAERIVLEAAAEGGPAEPVVEGPSVPPLKPPSHGVPSTPAVAAGLITVGAVAGVAAGGAVRHWWRTGRRR